MGILSDFFIADKNSFPEYDCGPDFPAEDRCQLKSLTSLEAAGIFAVLKGRGDAVELMDEFSLITPEDAEEFIETVPEEMVQLLANIEEGDIKIIAEKCAIETEEELHWTPDDFEPVISELRQLASRTVEYSKAMYLWSSL